MTVPVSKKENTYALALIGGRRSHAISELNMEKQHELSPSTRAIEAAILSVPRGRVSTYGEIALAAGMPNGARQVVRVLCSRSRKADLPWFRILGKGKKAGTARISLAGEGSAEQRALLAAEGVDADDEGIVDLIRFGYSNRIR